MQLTDTILHKLLQRGERARIKGSARAIRESLVPANGPYWELGLDQRESLHERMRRAENAGAVRLEWSRLGGSHRPLEGVVLVDVDRLAAFVGVATASAVLAEASRILSPWRGRVPCVDHLLEAWANLKEVRGLAPDSAADFADALRLMDVLASDPDEDKVVRQVSATVFGDSKRIEALRKHLDILTSESISAPARHWEEVFAALGLIKEPQPFLLAGVGSVELQGGETCPIVSPFVGVSNRAVMGFKGQPAWVLTIENLTTFHQAAKRVSAERSGLVLYTGGMPSPAWARAYRRLLEALSPDVPVLHWGDVDEGGFRIARRVRECVPEGRTYRPWLMEMVKSGKPASMASAAAMAASADAVGWTELAAQLREASPPTTVEQERLSVRLPG